MSEIIFNGSGPFVLSVAQGVKAYAEGEQVMIAVRLLTTPSQQGWVLLPMTPDQAAQLSGELSLSASQALGF